MRVLTAISGIILAATGAFCFAFYKNGFAGTAFILGVALFLEGICHVVSYGISFRKNLLPDTVLVEGLYDAALSVAVLADMVSDSNVMMVFGTWLLVSGVIRFSQSLAVSRINSRGWFTLLPFGIVNALAGLVMIMPTVLSGVNNMQMLAVAYLLNGFSLMVYAIYMVKRESNPKADEAKKRAEAKKQIAEEKRRKRDELRSMSEADREAKIEEARAEKRKADEERKASRQAQREAERAKRRPASDQTVELSDEEVAEIAEITSEAAPEISEAAKEIEAEIEEPEKEESVSARPVWVKPTNVPKIEKLAQSEEESVDAGDDIKKLSEKRDIVNLEEFEEKLPEVELPKIELPKLELKASGGESAQRMAFLLELEDEKPEEKISEEDINNLQPLTLEELFADERFQIKPLSDPKATETDLKLTQTFTFDWLNTKMQ